MKRNQSGFTLIEIAIVLVIIGLLLGGVLKGQELINSAKVKNLATDFKNTPVFIYGYQDKFKALPGDDRNALTHVSGVAATGTANGLIDGLWLPAAVGDESALFWQHVRLANLAPGETTVAVGATNTFQPKNAVGGFIGVTGAANTPIIGMLGSYIVCSDNIAGKFAKQLDITLDNGVTNTGSIRVTTAGVTAATAATTPPLADDTTYLVCMGF